MTIWIFGKPGCQAGPRFKTPGVDFIKSFKIVFENTEIFWSLNFGVQDSKIDILQTNFGV